MKCLKWSLKPFEAPHLSPLCFVDFGTQHLNHTFFSLPLCYLCWFILERICFSLPPPLTKPFLLSQLACRFTALKE